MGISFPTLEYSSVTDGRNIDDSILGLSRGGRKIQQFRDKFTGYLQVLIKLASLHMALAALTDALERMCVGQKTCVPLLYSTSVYKPTVQYTEYSVDGEHDNNNPSCVFTSYKHIEDQTLPVSPTTAAQQPQQLSDNKEDLLISQNIALCLILCIIAHIVV